MTISVDHWADDGKREARDVVVAGDIGTSMQIWHDADDPDEATKDAPQPIRLGLSAQLVAFVGFLGVIAIYALIRQVFEGFTQRRKDAKKT